MFVYVLTYTNSQRSFVQMSLHVSHKFSFLINDQEIVHNHNLFLLMLHLNI